MKSWQKTLLALLSLVILAGAVLATDTPLLAQPPTRPPGGRVQVELPSPARVRNPVAQSPSGFVSNSVFVVLRGPLQSTPVVLRGPVSAGTPVLVGSLTFANQFVEDLPLPDVMVLLRAINAVDDSCIGGVGSPLVDVTAASVRVGDTVHLSFPFPLVVNPSTSNPWCLVAQFDQEVAEETIVNVTALFQLP